MDAPPLYSIRNWNRHYETYETRKLKKTLGWVAVPTKLDGAGYRWLIGQPNGMALFGAWVLILEVAAKCEPRGTLRDSEGRPLTAEKLALKTGGDPLVFQQALSLLASPEIGWVCVNLLEIQQGAGETGMPVRYIEPERDLPLEKAQPTKKTKKKNTEFAQTLIEQAAQISLPNSWSDNNQTRQAIADWLRHKQQRGERYKSPETVGTLLNGFVRQFGTAGQEKFLEAVPHSIGMNYSGCFAPRSSSNGVHHPGAGQKYNPKDRVQWE